MSYSICAIVLEDSTLLSAIFAKWDSYDFKYLKKFKLQMLIIPIMVSIPFTIATINNQISKD